MPLEFVTPSPQVLQTYRDGFLDLVGTPPPDDSAVHVPVYAIPLDAVVRSLGTAAEAPSGCRFYASYPPPIGTVSCEMTNPRDYGNARFRNMLDGEWAEWGWRRIQQMGALPELAHGGYTLNLLIMPSLFVEAFYLRANSPGGNAQVVPFDLFSETLGPPVVQDARAYLASLQPVAAARAAAPRDPLLP